MLALHAPWWRQVSIAATNRTHHTHAMLAVILTTLSALRLPSEGLLARRAVLINAASAAALIGIGPLAASADEASEFLAGVTKAQEKNLGPSVFEGTYSDPFHPGGTRTITLTDTKLGGFQLAKINGANPYPNQLTHTPLTPTLTSTPTLTLPRWRRQGRAEIVRAACDGLEGARQAGRAAWPSALHRGATLGVPQLGPCRHLPTRSPLAALGSSALPGLEGRATERRATASGARASPPKSPTARPSSKLANPNPNPNPN